MEATNSLPRLQILQLLELIEQCDKNIIHLFETGSTEKSFSIRQERYLLEKYCKELNEIVSNTYKGVELKIASKIAKAA